MRLSQSELDRVLLFNVAQMARSRLSRGVRLNYPEAAALIADEMMESAREGYSYESVCMKGTAILNDTDVMPGVAELLRGLVCEPVFEDGPRIVVLDEPIRDVAATTDNPGEVRFGVGPIFLNEGRGVTSIVVTNRSTKPVNIASHYHFFEVNSRMEFDRHLAYGRHLNIQAGRSILWAPSETKTVELIPYAGEGPIEGFQGLPEPGAGEA